MAFFLCAFSSCKGRRAWVGGEPIGKIREMSILGSYHTLPYYLIIYSSLAGLVSSDMGSDLGRAEPFHEYICLVMLPVLAVCFPSCRPGMQWALVHHLSEPVGQAVWRWDELIVDVQQAEDNH